MEINHRWISWSNGQNSKSFNPPDHISSNVYPELGAYSSHDKNVINKHLKTLSSIGIDAVIVNWFNQDHCDFQYSLIENSKNYSGFTDKTLSLLFDSANEYNLKIGINIPSYLSQNLFSISNDVSYYYEKYRNHKSVLKANGKLVVFIEDSDKVFNIYRAITNWSSKIFFISTFSFSNQIGGIMENGFDAISSQSPLESHQWSSSTSNWPKINELSNSRKLYFIPKVSPGFSLSSKNSKRMSNEGGKTNSFGKRNNGEYYRNMWSKAILIKPNFVIVDSFNDWLKGTAIEAAQEKSNYLFNSDIWCESGCNGSFYLNITEQIIKEYKEKFLLSSKEKRNINKYFIGFIFVVLIISSC